MGGSLRKLFRSLVFSLFLSSLVSLFGSLFRCSGHCSGVQVSAGVLGLPFRCSGDRPGVQVAVQVFKWPFKCTSGRSSAQVAIQAFNFKSSFQLSSQRSSHHPSWLLKYPKTHNIVLRSYLKQLLQLSWNVHVLGFKNQGKNDIVRCNACKSNILFFLQKSVKVLSPLKFRYLPFCWSALFFNLLFFSRTIIWGWGSVADQGFDVIIFHFISDLDYAIFYVKEFVSIQV